MADEERRFPIQGGLTVSWDAAERAYKTYLAHFGCDQSLVRIAERAGFGIMEFVNLYNGKLLGTVDEATLARTLFQADVQRRKS